MDDKSTRRDPSEVSKTEIADFYNDFSSKLVRGYVTGNPRVDHAMEFAISQVPTSASRLLEIGCGVGETTHRLCGAKPDLRAVGVDISDQNIRVAQQLFGGQPNVQFTVSDLTLPVAGGPFDVVTLIDVYEHIPAAERQRFHRNLRQSMAANSRLIVTCPSYLHQNYLRNHQPDGLQIIDETIGAAELLQLADDLGGQLSHLHYESVWRTNDYIYATIDMQMIYQWKDRPRGLRRLSSKVAQLLKRTPIGGPSRRERLVRRRLAA